jgi:AAA domain/Primase C terminal 2 (PriCT-2)
VTRRADPWRGAFHYLADLADAKLGPADYATKVRTLYDVLVQELCDAAEVREFLLFHLPLQNISVQHRKLTIKLLPSPPARARNRPKGALGGKAYGKQYQLYQDWIGEKALNPSLTKNQFAKKRLGITDAQLVTDFDPHDCDAEGPLRKKLAALLQDLKPARIKRLDEGHRMAAVPTNNKIRFAVPDWALKQKPAEIFANQPRSRLAEGLEADIDEVRSAAVAIPPSAIATENEWMKFARALAYEAALFNDRAEVLWGILDEVSRRAPGYDKAENRSRWLRYIREAFSSEKPITIQTLFHFALDYGWSGNRQSQSSTPSSVATPVNRLRSVPVSGLPLVPPKRRWLHGTDLIKGAVTVLYAPGGRAKSTWLLGCALACASGRPLLGSHVFGGPLRVLYLSTEDGFSEMALRLRAAMNHYAIADADAPELHIIAADSWGLPLLRAEGNCAVIDLGGMNALTAELDEIRPDVLIIDPLIKVMGGVNANDNAAAALLIVANLDRSCSGILTNWRRMNGRRIPLRSSRKAPREFWSPWMIRSGWAAGTGVVSWSVMCSQARLRATPAWSTVLRMPATGSSSSSRGCTTFSACRRRNSTNPRLPSLGKHGSRLAAADH